ncbi:MAG: cyclic nucleotide-binding domain-containing protein [Acidimicrobiales bacterium]
MADGPEYATCRPWVYAIPPMKPTRPERTVRPSSYHTEDGERPMARRDLYLERLARLPMFRAYSPTELALIAGQAEDLRFAPGTALVREGEPGSEAFLIVDGTASVTIDDIQVAVLGPGDHFGELALLDVAARQATVTTITPLEALVLGRREFTTSIQSLPILAHKVLTGLACHLHDTQRVEKVCG